MTQSQHTPGPWFIKRDAYTDFPYIEAKHNSSPRGMDRRIATVSAFDNALKDCRNPYEANAKLIAAAPDLLEELENAVDYLKHLRHGYASKGENTSQISSRIRQYSAAIAKARGQE